MSVILAGTFRVPPANAEALKPHMLAVISASRAEDGCVAYAFGVDLDDPGLIHVFEVWRDQAALDAHWKRPHMDAWREARAALGFHDKTLTTYHVAEER